MKCTEWIQRIQKSIASALKEFTPILQRYIQVQMQLFSSATV